MSREGSSVYPLTCKQACDACRGGSQLSRPRPSIMSIFNPKVRVQYRVTRLHHHALAVTTRPRKCRCFIAPAIKPC
jgi:hypothetical protein